MAPGRAKDIELCSASSGGLAREKELYRRGKDNFMATRYVKRKIMPDEKISYLLHCHSLIGNRS
jgi:hypothetical protein